MKTSVRVLVLGVRGCCCLFDGSVKGFDGGSNPSRIECRENGEQVRAWSLRDGASLAGRRLLEAVSNVRVLLQTSDVLRLTAEVAGDVGLLRTLFAGITDGATKVQPCGVDDLFGKLLGLLNSGVRSVEGSHRVGHLSIITPLMWPP